MPASAVVVQSFNEASSETDDVDPAADRRLQRGRGQQGADADRDGAHPEANRSCRFGPQHLAR